MTSERFNEVVDEELARIEKVLVKKQGEYNLDEDRMSHFKNASDYLRQSPYSILMSYRAKHETSIVDMVNDMVENGAKFSRDLWLEKITDNINYLILLLGLIEDKDDFKKENK